MSTTETDRPTATFPTGQWLADQAAHRERLSGLRADAAPTERLPVGPAAGARPRKHSLRGLYQSPQARRSSHCATAPLRHRHLRAALTGPLIAAAVLIPMQLFAAQGISSARQAALAQRDERATAQPGQAAPAPSSQPDVRSDIQADWVTGDTGAAYDRTNPAASPLDLPRCTTSPDTPLPCLATISPDSSRAVVLEEDTSLTALVRR